MHVGWTYNRRLIHYHHLILPPYIWAVKLLQMGKGHARSAYFDQSTQLSFFNRTRSSIGFHTILASMLQPWNAEPNSFVTNFQEFVWNEEPALWGSDDCNQLRPINEQPIPHLSSYRNHLSYRIPSFLSPDTTVTAVAPPLPPSGSTPGK